MVNRFKLARLEEGKKQIQVPIETRIPLCTLSAFENGWRVPRPTELEKLKKALPKLQV